MKTKDLSKLPEGAILLVVKNSNGTFSPLGINPDQGRIITAFIGKLSEEQPLVVAKGIELITNRSPPAGRNDFGRYTNLRAAGISATRRSRRFAILTIIDMIGKKLSPVLEEMEATLWEYEAFNGAKPNYTLEGFRASTKIFMSALLDKFFEKQQAEGVSQEDTLKAVEKLGQDVRALVFNATGIDTHLLYNRTKVN